MIHKPSDIAAVEMSIVDADDYPGLPRADHLKLSNVNMCPKWGIIRYELHKVFSGSGRQMALEAGIISHDCYAAMRLYQLLEQGHVELFYRHGPRVLGADRFKQMCTAHFVTAIEEIAKAENPARYRLSHGLDFALGALHHGTFYDDPRDTRRTITNIEESIIGYFNQYEFDKWEVWVRDDNIGVEIKFSILMKVSFHDGSCLEFIYTGLVDGLMVSKSDDELRPHENKTGARIDDTWSLGMQMSHQVTGYCVAASLLTERHCGSAVVHGMQIPLPRSTALSGLRVELISRHDHRIEKWVQWATHTMEVIMMFKDDPLNAPEYTHSCNRYYKACSFVPLCDSDLDTQKQMLDEMDIQEWNPLEE